MFTKALKYRNTYQLYAFLIIASATIFRIVLSRLGWPPTDSDEATYNLMAFHIWKNGEHPIFMYGGNYLGAIEAYIGSVLFRLFGPSMLVMRIEMAGLFALFLLGLYLLTYRLYSPRFALVTIAFLALGTVSMLVRQLKATGGNAEINVFGVFVLLISFMLASGRIEKGWKRAILYSLWGMFSGLALWSHILIAPYLLVASILLVVFCWREMLKWGLWLLLIGFVVSGFPLIYYNLTSPPDANSWATYSHLSTMGIPANDIIWTHIIRTALVSLPLMTGDQFAPFITSWPSKVPHAFRYATMQYSWSIGYCLLLLCSISLTIAALIRSQHQDRTGNDTRAQQVARLLLGCAAILTIVLYVKGSATVVDAYNSARYLSILWISAPVVLWPLWRGLRFIRSLPLWFNFCKMSFIAAVWEVVGGILLLSTMYIIQEIPQAQARDQQLTQLTATLERLHVTRFYSEYWTCNNVIFASQERLICGDSQVEKGPAFVFPENDNYHIQTLKNLVAQQHIEYHRVDVAGYAVFILARPLQNTRL
ncbi:MAG: hypothetical protein E6J48_14265 [Chloroflexi bacterium]|nr:MAG: hypothetical protein E6J48_14265 [Chloroflexota bacterium]